MPFLDKGPSLLLAAIPPELAELDAKPPLGWQVRCTGVGAIAGGVATAGLLVELKPSRVLFVGTCGSYDDRLAVGDFVEASEALSVSLDELEGRAYRSSLERVRWPSTLAFSRPLEYPRHTVAVPTVITKTSEGAQLLSALAAAEHLELTAVFAACTAVGIPCGGILAVSNHVGPDTRRQWVDNNAKVSQALIESLIGKGVFLPD